MLYEVITITFGSEDGEEVCLYACDKLGNMALVDKIALSKYRNSPTRAQRTPQTGMLAALLLLLLLIPLFAYRNVRFHLVYADGSTRKARFYRRYRKGGIEIRLKDRLLENIVSAEMIIVITSYSIHYTKLYDM